MFTPRRSRQPSMRRKQRYFHWCSPRRGARHRFPMLRRAGHSRNQSRELTAISDKDTKGCRFVSFCTLAGFMKMIVKSLFRMAGTTRLELATSAVTVSRTRQRTLWVGLWVGKSCRWPRAGRTGNPLPNGLVSFGFLLHAASRSAIY